MRHCNSSLGSSSNFVGTSGHRETGFGVVNLLQKSFGSLVEPLEQVKIKKNISLAFVGFLGFDGSVRATQRQLPPELRRVRRIKHEIANGARFRGVRHAVDRVITHLNR